MAYPSKTVVILRGNPGVGKSILAKQLGGTIISADLYPGLYGKDPANPVYQLSMQKVSHEWSKEEFFKAIEREDSLIIVDNTNIRLLHMQGYRDVAADCGYVVQISHIESLTDDREVPFNSTHFQTTAEGWKMQQETRERYDRIFEPLLKPEPGFTTDEIINMSNFKHDDNHHNGIIISDVIGTLVKSNDSKSHYVNDLEVVEFDYLAINSLVQKMRHRNQKTCYLATNQVGVRAGHVTLETLHAIYDLLTEHIINCEANQTEMKGLSRVDRVSIFTATERDKYAGYRWESIGPDTQKERFIPVPSPIAKKFSKPNIGMISAIVEDALIMGFLTRSDDHNFDFADHNIVYIGDAHLPTRCEDLKMVRNYNRLRDVCNSANRIKDFIPLTASLVAYQMIYCPVELLKN